MLSRSQIKEVQQLHLKKFRDASKMFIAEGVKTVLEIVANRPDIVDTVFGDREFVTRHAGTVRNQKITVHEVEETELKKMSMQATPNQVLAVCTYFEVKEPEIPTFTFYLDDIRDPGNMGTILRIADWFGMPAVYCSPGSCDLYNPKVLQASMGSFLRVHLKYTLLSDLLRKQKFEAVFGAVLDGKSVFEERLSNGLMIIGNEANGIHARNLGAITRPVTIPSAAGSGAESLNAAMAAAIIASEHFRQMQS